MEFEKSKKKYFITTVSYFIFYCIFVVISCELTGFDSNNCKNCCSDLVHYDGANDDKPVNGADCLQDGNDANVTYCSQSIKVEKRAWEASLSSLKSKRVKGSQLVDCQSGSSWGFISDADRTNSCSMEAPHRDSLMTKNSEKYIGDHLHAEAPVNLELPSTKQRFRIMLMNITDQAKKTQLEKVCLTTRTFYKCFN